MRPGVIFDSLFAGLTVAGLVWGEEQAEQAEDTKTRSLPPLQPPTAAQLETVRQVCDKQHDLY